MSRTVTPPPPPSPSALKPLKQSIQEIREESAPSSPNNPSVQPVQPVQKVIDSPSTVNDFSKLKKAGSIVTNGALAPSPTPPAPPASPQQVAEEVSNIPPPTYYEGGDENSGFIEFDLQSYRQRGVEERYLNISLLALLEAVDVDDQDVVDGAVGNLARNTMKITDKTQFEALKSFFNSLEWED